MRVLLDTHALFWWLYFPELLPPKVHDIFDDPDARIVVSAVSAYEMSYKYHRGRWSEVEPLVAAFEEVVLTEGFELLALSAMHAIRAGTYSSEHRDPFDRMLAAQAEVDDLTLVSKDRWLRKFGVEAVWR